MFDARIGMHFWKTQGGNGSTEIEIPDRKHSLYNTRGRNRLIQLEYQAGNLCARQLDLHLFYTNFRPLKRKCVGTW